VKGDDPRPDGPSVADLGDPASIPLEQLRSLRAALQAEDDAVSYARRIAQARLDLVRAEIDQRRAPTPANGIERGLREVLSSHLTGAQGVGASPRPPRPVDHVADHEWSQRLDKLCAERGMSRLPSLGLDELDELAAALAEFERVVSDDRRARFARLDDLGRELVRRYRDGEATVDGLLE